MAEDPPLCEQSAEHSAEPGTVADAPVPGEPGEAAGLRVVRGDVGTTAPGSRPDGRSRPAAAREQRVRAVAEAGA